jgi:hypothetical protein
MSLELPNETWLRGRAVWNALRPWVLPGQLREERLQLAALRLEKGSGSEPTPFSVQSCGDRRPETGIRPYLAHASVAAPAPVSLLTKILNWKNRQRDNYRLYEWSGRQLPQPMAREGKRNIRPGVTAEVTNGFSHFYLLLKSEVLHRLTYQDIYDTAEATAASHGWKEPLPIDKELLKETVGQFISWPSTERVSAWPVLPVDSRREYYRVFNHDHFNAPGFTGAVAAARIGPVWINSQIHHETDPNLKCHLRLANPGWRQKRNGPDGGSDDGKLPSVKGSKWNSRRSWKTIKKLLRMADEPRPVLQIVQTFLPDNLYFENWVSAVKYTYKLPYTYELPNGRLVTKDRKCTYKPRPLKFGYNVRMGIKFWFLLNTEKASPADLRKWDGILARLGLPVNIARTRTYESFCRLNWSEDSGPLKKLRLLGSRHSLGALFAWTFQPGPRGREWFAVPRTDELAAKALAQEGFATHAALYVRLFNNGEFESETVARRASRAAEKLWELYKTGLIVPGRPHHAGISEMGVEELQWRVMCAKDGLKETHASRRENARREAARGRKGRYRDRKVEEATFIFDESEAIVSRTLDRIDELFTKNESKTNSNH